MGLEDLAAQIEKLQKEGDSRVCGRFNACAYLAEYLMRNNPKHNPEKTKDLAKLYAQFAKKEKMERVLSARKALLRSLFVRAAGEHKEIEGQIKAFIASLDQDLQLKVKVKDVIDIVFFEKRLTQINRTL